jgi:AAA family ATPase
LTALDLVDALPFVRPSALRSLGVSGTDTPVRYSDIGGLSSVIQKLRECVEWPLKHPGTIYRFSPPVTLIVLVQRLSQGWA